MTSLSELRFFKTPAHDCSYLDDRQAVTLFVDPMLKVDTELYSALSAVGFRRSGQHIYRPYCETCTACIPVRLPVASFTLLRRQKRTLKKNIDVRVTRCEPRMRDDYFAVYDRYITARHSDGDMFPASPDQFESFLVDGRPEASFYEFRVSGKLLAIAVADQLDDSLSAIYTFFEPEEDKRSLGTFAVLWLIEETKRLELQYLYLGYWIKHCQKMSYKTDYRPLEMYIEGHWTGVPD